MKLIVQELYDVDSTAKIILGPMKSDGAHEW
jgi:hypothetical protein